MLENERKKKCNEKSNAFKRNDQRETFYIFPSFIKVKRKWKMLKNVGEIYENWKYYYKIRYKEEQ